MSSLFKVRTNVGSLRAYHILSEINDRILKVAERISSGKKINRASDSPSGYFISRTMQLDILRLKEMQQNLERGINWLQSNDSRLSQVLDLLEEMYSVSSMAATGGITSAERVALQLDLNGFVEEIDAILQSGVSAALYTGFSLGNLLNVSLTGTSVPSASDLGVTGLVLTGTSTDSATMQNATAALRAIEAAMTRVLKDEERIGSWIHRLDFQKAEASVDEVNQRASLSTIADADLAAEQVELTKLQILQQTALAMLAQSNTFPSSILSMIGA
jgi:flagellin